MSSKKFLITFMMMMLLISPSLAAVSLDDAIRGNDGELLTSVTDYAGSGEFLSEDGAALAASFRMPQHIVVLEDGTVLISDMRNQLIRQVKSGQVSIFAGFAALPVNAMNLPIGALVDGDLETAVFNEPAGLSVDGKGNIYVADSGNHAIRKISPTGKVTTVAGSGVLGDDDGKGAEARFYTPMDVVATDDGVLYVADTLNHVIRKISPSGEVTTLTAASDRVVEIYDGVVLEAGDFADGPIASAKFNEPSGLALDEKGNLYVSDSGNHLIRYIDFASGTVSTVAGTLANKNKPYAEGSLYAEPGYANGAAAASRFNSPKGLAVTAEGGLLIADSMNNAIRYLLNGEVITLAGSETGQYGRDSGINGQHLFDFPTDVATSNDGNVLIVDSFNNKIREFAFYKLPSDLPQNDEIKVVLDQQLLTFDAKPEIVNSRTMVPLRSVGEALDFTVVYEQGEEQIQLSKKDTTITLFVDQPIMVIERQGERIEETLDVAPYIRENRTYVPLRFFSEHFGLDVQWYAPDRTVILR